MKLIFTLFILITSTLAGAMTCKLTGVDVPFGDELTLNITDDAIAIDVDGTVDKYLIDSAEWDGHKAGIVRSGKMKIKYENHYGCYRNVELIANLGYGRGGGSIRTYRFNSCAGGSTADDLCLKE